VSIAGVGVNSCCERHHSDDGLYLKHTSHVSIALSQNLTAVVGVTLHDMVVSLYYSAFVFTNVNKLKEKSSQDLSGVYTIAKIHNTCHLTIHFQRKGKLKLSHASRTSIVKLV